MLVELVDATVPVERRVVKMVGHLHGQEQIDLKALGRLPQTVEK